MIALWLLACGSEESVEAPAPASPGPPAAGVGPPGPPPGGPPGGGPGGPPSFQAETTYDLAPGSGEVRSVVLISLDTVRADHLGVYGGRAETPVLTSFGDQGVRFETALTGFPETCVSHWSMLTGVLPKVHGNIPGNGGSLYQGPTLAELAGKAGVTSGAIIGGITLQDRMCGLARGFDHYDDSYDFLRADTRPGAEVTAAAVKWIAAQTGPYFAFVHYFDAHTPYTPGPPWDTRYDPGYTGTITGELNALGIHGGGGGAELSPADLAHVVALYDGELSELDALLQPVLEAAGPDALVVITSDHGESFEHGYYFNHRAGLWDSVLRVPWLMRGPGVPVGTTVDTPVSLVDLAPTVAALAGWPTDARMQGVDQRPALGGAETPATVHHALTDPWMPDPQFAARSATAKVIWQRGATLIYDLASDPEELDPSGNVPPALAGAQQAHDASIAALSEHQAASPKQGRFMSQDTVNQLEALGYVDPQQAPPTGGTPPGRPPPPPNRGPR